MNPLLSALAQWAEAVANGALRLDPAARERIARLDGCAIRFATPFDEPVTVEFAGEHLRIMARATERPNAIVHASPLSLLAAGVGAAPQDLRIDGDEAIVEDFRALIADLRPDLDEPMSRILGREGAETLFGLAELGGRALLRFAKGVREDGRDAISAGARRQLVDRDALNQFSERVLEAQTAADRLAARITALEQASTS